MVWRRILIQELSLSWGDLVVRLKNLDYNVHIHGEFCGNVSIKIFESGDPLHQSHHLCVEDLGVFACHPWILYWQESIKVGIRGYECTQGGNNKPLVLRYILLTPVIHFCYPVPPGGWEGEEVKTCHIGHTKFICIWDKTKCLTLGHLLSSYLYLTLLLSLLIGDRHCQILCPSY